MKRRIASILTALALCLSLLPGTAWAAGGHRGGHRYRLEWQLGHHGGREKVCCATGWRHNGV